MTDDERLLNIKFPSLKVFVVDKPVLLHRSMLALDPRNRYKIFHTNDEAVYIHGPKGDKGIYAIQHCDIEHQDWWKIEDAKV